jgi:hypothetical protein
VKQAHLHESCVRPWQANMASMAKRIGTMSQNAIGSS